VETDKSPSVSAAKQYTDTSVSTEATARASSDNNLQTNITNESSARIAADGVLQTNINNENAARTAADSLLQANIDAETAARVIAVTNEETARIAADNVLQTNISNEANTRSVADANLHDEITGEIAARQTADALLIPLTQKGAADGVATLDSSGIIPLSQIPAGATPVQSVNAKTGAVVLSTLDIAEDTNLYFTDARAKTAAVIDSTIGSEIDKAPSVHSAKEFTTNSVAAEKGEREAADALLIPLSQKGVADGVATLDNTGKIPASQIPPTAITSVAVVATIAERDALVAQEGDFCVVTDINETFVYNGAEWIELQVGSAVISVNGKTGAVSLSTTDIAEGDHLYYTDSRAKLATVIDSSVGTETDKAMSVAAAKMFTTDTVQTETAAREAADALLIPLTQKGVADGVATLDSSGIIPVSQIPAAATPVQSVNARTGAVVLSTLDIAEDTNLYYTDARAKTATVVNDMSGTEIEQAPSVSAVKAFITTEIAAEAALRASADTDLQNNINAEATARQEADALLIPLSQKGAPLGVATLDASGKIDSSLVPGSASELGTPTRGTYAGGLLSFTTNTLIADAADETNLILAKLAPAKPPNLSTKTIALTTSYSAKEAGTNTLRSNVTDVLKPQISTITQFYDGDSGVLTAEIDSADAGNVTLTTTSQAGTYGALVVTADVDYYAGQSGKEGFWRALSGYIVAATNLSYGPHTYQMKHSTTGNTNLLSFYVDNPGSPTISGDTFDLIATVTSYISGVPSLSSGSQIKFNFSVAGAVGKFFNSTKVADVSGSNISTVNIPPAGAGYTENETITVTNATVTVNSGSYSESPSASMRGYNSKSVSGTAKTVSLGSRIDTSSNESARKVSGSGQYPATGYGGVYDSTQSLKTAYSEELQMLGGSYQRPASVNYTSNVPTPGPDYSTGMGTSDRWVTFTHGSSLSNASAFTLTINGASGSWSGTATSGVKIYAKVEGVTGWIDCNASYPGVGSPSNNGDPAMVFGSSSATSKRVTFGSTSRSGTLYIRIGLPSGSDKKFTSITVGSIV